MAKWATAVHNIWPQLSRAQSPDVAKSPARHSAIAVPHTFIMPGGRFREQYYWDAFFILRGLVISDMFETARNTVDNFAHVIRQLGFVPNGMRVYYATRSQPPLLSAMVRMLHNASQDLTLLKAVAPALAMERDYWTLPECQHANPEPKDPPCRNNSKSVTINTGKASLLFARYYAATTEPRPESYNVDVKLAASHHMSDAQRKALFRELATGAETGTYTARGVCKVTGADVMGD